MSSRKPDNPGNQMEIRRLVKLDCNKSCADCKKNKHPRWASWNLGIFVCIRCSGIHRGMGTHISRVKSVDLDSWTDEQLASMKLWGNARANKYWEAKLANDHVPTEAKLENFIRTKYDTKRWVMDGPMPDPNTLDAGSDATHVPAQAPSRTQPPPGMKPPIMQNATSNTYRPQPDLFGDDQQYTSNTGAIGSTPFSNPTLPAQSFTQPPVQPPKPAQAAGSLLNFDFFGNSQPTNSTSSVAAPQTSSGVPPRTDLKNSILSLYSSSSIKAAPSTAQSSNDQFGSSVASKAKATSSSADLADIFGDLNFGSSSQAAPVTSTAPSMDFFSTTNESLPVNQPAVKSPSIPTGGSFFDTKPTTTNENPSHTRTERALSGFGDFAAADSAAQISSQKPSAPIPSMNTLFDLSGPAPEPTIPTKPTILAPPVSQPPPINISSYTANPAFNLSSQMPKDSSNGGMTKMTTTSNVTHLDPWASSEGAWGGDDGHSSAHSAAPSEMSGITDKSPNISISATSQKSQQTPFGGWGDTYDTPAPPNPHKPSVARDDDFGGWSSSVPEPEAVNHAASHMSPSRTTEPPSYESNDTRSAPTQTFSTTSPIQSTAPPKTFAASEDLFDNVWG